DKLAYSSKLSNIRAAEKIFFAAVPLLICLFANSILVSVITISAMFLANIIMGGIYPKQYIKLLLLPFGFLIIGVITIIVNKIEPGSPDKLLYFHLFGGMYGITMRSLIMGIGLFLKAFAAVSCMYFISLNTPMNSIFNYFRRLKLPSLFIELMELIYRFIFVVWNEAGKIRCAQNSRLGYVNFESGLKSTAGLISMVFVKSMNRVEKTNLAYESRGFDGEFKYLIEEEMGSKTVLFLGAILSSVLLAISIFERIR
ncbi:MAG: cobalt ECF transporter T component CbiQ, partial [Clostridiales bacterium]|nr:cobalt ECF transporter T component CbiQ [Clostridiales bacterium]